VDVDAERPIEPQPVSRESNRRKKTASRIRFKAKLLIVE
jgi:hypothetical protein